MRIATGDTREEMLTETEADVADMREEVLAAIAGIMSARKAAHAAADAYLTARSVLDGAIGRWTGEEHEDEVLTPAPAPEHDERPMTRTDAAKDEAPRLDWNDPAACRAWLAELRESVTDAVAVGEDITDPPSKRQLGRAAAVQLLGEASYAIDYLFGVALRGLPPEPQHEAPAPVGDPAGSGGAGGA
jgi:hypothetical protein